MKNDNENRLNFQSQFSRGAVESGASHYSLPYTSSSPVVDPLTPVAYSSGAERLAYYGAAAAYDGEQDKDDYVYDEREQGFPARTAVEFIPDRPALYVTGKEGGLGTVRLE